MIRWCAYCQRYQGEVAPFDDYSVTHTICPECNAKGAFRQKPDAGLAAIRDFFGRIPTAVLTDGVTGRDIVAEGASLGLDPVDLMLGILQPLLHQLGARWERSEVSIAEEHRISAACAEVIDSVLFSDEGPQLLRRRRPPAVLLTAADDNHHVLGIRILEVVLLRRSIPTLAVYPGLPAQEIVALAHGLRPRVVGISAVTEDHVVCAQEVADRLAAGGGRAAPLPRVFVGGLAVRMGSLPQVRPPLVAAPDLEAFLEQVIRALDG